MSSMMSAVLIGEHVNSSSKTCNHHPCSFVEVASPKNDPVDSLGVLEDMLVKSMVWEGLTVVNDEGLPTLHSHGTNPERFSNRKFNSRRVVRAPEGSGQHAEGCWNTLMLLP